MGTGTGWRQRLEPSAELPLGGGVCSLECSEKRAKPWVPTVAGLRGLPPCLACSVPAQCSEQGFVAVRSSLRQEKNGGLVTCG